MKIHFYIYLSYLEEFLENKIIEVKDGLVLEGFKATSTLFEVV